MAALDLTSFDAVLKKYYTDKQVANLVYRSRPALGMIPKNPAVKGKSYEVPITIGAIGGRSKGFALGKANKTPSVHKRFTIPMSKNYAFADIDGLTMRAAASDRGAFFEAATSEIDSALRQLANDSAGDLYGDGLGVRGVVGAVAATDLTLATTKDIHKWEVGMTLEFATGSATAVVDGGTLTPTTAQVVGIDRGLGVLTVDANPGIIVGDFLFAVGDATSGGARPDKLIGFGGWLPDHTTVTATPFFGVDRTADLTRLAGVNYDGSAGTVEEALINGGSALFEEGGNPDVVFMHPTRVAELDRALEGRGRYEKTNSTMGDVGFSAITIHTGAGPVQVMSDPWCPLDIAYMLQMNTWELISVGAMPGLLSHDGNRVLRVVDADAIEVQAGYYANLSCSAPGYNCRIALA